MTFIKLHWKADGRDRYFRPEEIQSVGEEPAGQCMVYLADGTTFQPEESVEDVLKLLDNNKP
jgi:hypothetical protein